MDGALPGFDLPTLEDELMPFDPGYGLIAVFGLVLVQQLGAPIPAWPALMISGAYTVVDPLHGAAALVLATTASIVGSLPWFWAGWRYGHRVLRFTCRISLSPDACVHKTGMFFERYGVVALLVSKFVPGLTHVAPPLAGTFRLRVTRFALYFGAGSALAAFVPLALGVAFHVQIGETIAWLGEFGGHALAGIAAAVALYVVYRWLVRRRVARRCALPA